MSAALTSSHAVARSMSSRGPDALVSREVDLLVSKLLSEINVPFGSLGTRVLTQLSDLKKILSTDYMEVPALPEKRLLKELARVVENDIKKHTPTYEGLADLASPQLIAHLENLFGPRQLELRAEPYKTGAGLSLRGFYCRAEVGAKSKFVIFVNTAHHPGAVAATLGHELGHYIYGSLVGEKAQHTAFMEGAFANHLAEEDEYISKEAQTEIKAALKDRLMVTVYSYPGCNHAFAHHNGIHYDVAAAALANARTSAFLESHLK